MLSPLYGQLSPLRVPTKAVRQVQDSDALAYIAAVEIADGQSLEAAAQYAYEDFILGCKADGIWTALKASCILAGARTLSGALVPLIGSAPTNFNFVSGDYNRKTGVKGRPNTTRINTNRTNNADPRDNQHMCVYYSEASSYSSTVNRIEIGNGLTGAGSTWIGRATTAPGNFSMRNRSSTGDNSGIEQNANNAFCGVSRSSRTEFAYRYNGTQNTIARTSQDPTTGIIQVFCTNNYGFSDARLGFYSIGESLDLALLDARVSTLMTDISNAIP